MSTLETLHDRGSRELANFIIDLEDEDCPKFHLHLAAYQGDIEQLTTLLKEDEFKKVNWYQINLISKIVNRLCKHILSTCLFVKSLVT